MMEKDGELVFGIREVAIVAISMFVLIIAVAAVRSHLRQSELATAGLQITTESILADAGAP